MKQDLLLKCLKVLILSSLILQGGCNWVGKKPGASDSAGMASMGSEQEDETVMNDFETDDEPSMALGQQDEEEEFELEETFEPTRSMRSQSQAYVPASRRYPPMRPKQIRGRLSANLEEFDDEVLEVVNKEELKTEKLEYVTYVARKGDSMWAIARKNGVSLSEVLDLNGMTKASVLKVGQKLIIPATEANLTKAASVAKTSSDVYSEETEVYTVTSGDSLSRIAAIRGTTVSKLKAANNLVSDIIRIGQKLEVPKGSMPYANPVHSVAKSSMKPHDAHSYTIRPGDTLSVIARKYSMSTSELMELNDISDSNKIRAGQVLKVTGVAKANNTKFPTIEETVSTLAVAPKIKTIFEVEVDDTMFDDMDPDESTVLIDSEAEVTDSMAENSIFDSAEGIELVPVEFSAGLE